MLLKEENIAEENNISEYETERNKPMPNRIHGTIQSAIIFLLMLKYKGEFNFTSEVSLDSTPPTTPDISIFNSKILDWQTIEAKEKEVPQTTIEIISPSQSLDEMTRKVIQTYFPMGVQSAWIVMPPPMRAICVLTPDGKKKFYDTGILKDPATGIELEVDKVFEGLK